MVRYSKEDQKIMAEMKAKLNKERKQLQAKKDKENLAKLHKVGFYTMQDVYNERDKSGKSVFGILSEIIGSDAAHNILHILSMKNA